MDVVAWEGDLGEEQLVAALVVAVVAVERDAPLVRKEDNPLGREDERVGDDWEKRGGVGWGGGDSKWV